MCVCVFVHKYIYIYIYIHTYISLHIYDCIYYCGGVLSYDFRKLRGDIVE